MAEGKVCLFLAINRFSKFAYVELHSAANRMTGAAFPRSAVVTFPYNIHAVLTDNGPSFADQPRDRSGPTACFRGRVFDRVCREQVIEHRLTKPYREPSWVGATLKLSRHRPPESAVAMTMPDR